MRRERILAVIMSVLLALSMIPVTVFAAETTALDGKLNIQGSAAEGRTLSAEFKEVKPEGVTEDDVTYLWQRKTTEDEAAEKTGQKPELKELSKEKTYVVTQDDVGSKIVLTITGKEENGYSGSLKATSDTVTDAQTAADQETKAAEEKADAADENAENSEEQTSEENTEKVAEDAQDKSEAESTEDTQDKSEAESTESTQDQTDTESTEGTQETQQPNSSEDTDESYQEQSGTETVDGIPAATTDEEKKQDENAGSESVDGIPEATEDGTYEQNTDTSGDNNQDDQNTDIPQNPDVTPAASKVTASNTQPDFGTLVHGYADIPQETITLTNEGDADADLSDAVSSVGAAQGQYFDITWQGQTVAKNGGTALFTIQPKADLSANTYTESFTITDNGNDNTVVITATVTVVEEKHSLDISVSELNFATAKKGYGEIQAQQFTVTNNGNVTETLEQPALTNFDISVDQTQLAPGASAVYTVQPKTGLDVGTYSETIRVSSDKSVTVSLQVVKGNAVLTKIQQPSAVTGLANGTKKDASSLKLPSTVVIETTEGNMKAAVSWNVKDSSYKQSGTDAQKFTVSGTVTLPSGVDNDNQISLSTSVEVSVNAYSAKVASAENNKITGIDANGVYTTQSKISFTAVGAGMDNNSPRKGDTRYVPQSWTVINTNVWNAAPYTASFGLAQSGDYTLKVAFGQQQYDGSKWNSTGTTDTRQVSFSITKAKVTVPGTNLTPAANKKNAVKTGDNTPILPFVCILIVAAVAIGGVVFYKKKNKK